MNVHDAAALGNEHLKAYIREHDIRVYPLEGYELLKKHMNGNFLFLNVLIVGAMCGADVGNVSYEEVRNAVRELSPAKFADANMKVLELGYEALKGV